MFGVFKEKFTGISTNTLNSPNATRAHILASVPIGAMTEDLAILVWTFSIVYHAAGSPFQGLVFWGYVRDATVKPSVTDTDFLNAVPAGVSIGNFSSGIPGGVGDVSGDANLLSGLNGLKLSINVINSPTDSYGNAIKSGDSLVVDIGIIAQNAGTTGPGTYDLTVWFSVLLS